MGVVAERTYTSDTVHGSSPDYSRAEVAADARRLPEADGPSTANALQHSRVH
jgi:hypothetical protein